MTCNSPEVQSSVLIKPFTRPGQTLSNNYTIILQSFIFNLLS